MKITVKFYKTVNGKDTLRLTREFDTMEAAVEAADEWEARTIDNYAVFAQN